MLEGIVKIKKYIWIIAVMSVMLFSLSCSKSENKNIAVNNKSDKGDKSKEESGKDNLIDYEGDLYSNNAFENLKEEYECDKCINKIADYHAYDAVLEYTDTGFLIAPYNYDGDVKEYKKYIEKVAYSKEVQYYSIDVKNIEKVKENKYTHKCSFKKMEKKEVIQSLENGTSSGFVWFNKDNEIEKIIFYGSITIME